MATQFTTRYTFGFAAVICVVASVLVAGASLGLRPLQEVNERRDLRENILLALGLPEDPEVELAGPAIDELYEARVEVIVVDDAGNLVPDADFEDVTLEQTAAREEGRPPDLHAVYLRKDGERTGAYAIPMAGAGLWGPISGYLAIAPDGTTVSGATFFAPKETPGLGYEITAPAFIGQWDGKKIHDGEDFVPIDVVKGDAETLCRDRVEHCVDGVSGATITGRGVDAMVEDALETYEPYLTRVRAGGGA